MKNDYSDTMPASGRIDYKQQLEASLNVNDSGRTQSEIA
jgi:hypothetical protein